MGVKVREKVEGSGIFWVFINHRGKRTSRQVGSKRAAEKVKENIEARLKLGQDALPKEKPSAPTLEDYWEGLEDTYLPAGIRQSTLESYRRSFKNHILPEIGSMRLDELTREKIKGFVANLTQKRYTRLKKIVTVVDGKKQIEYKTIERPLSRASIRIILAELTAVLNHAKEDGQIQVNPAGRLGKLYKQAPVVHEEIQPLSAEEVPVFLTATKQDVPHYYELFLAALHTGMRSGELEALRWPDFDVHGKFIRVQKNVSRGKIGETKTGKSRRVDVSDELFHALLDLRRRRQSEYLARGKNEIPEWIFLSPGRIIWEGGRPVGREEGQRVEMHNVKNRVFHKCLAKAGLRRIRFHDLRHTYATLLLMQGESPAYVRDQLGHSSIKMTVDIYGHWIPGANRQAVNRLPGLNAKSDQAVAAD